MDCPLLRSGVAAAQRALQCKPEGSPTKSEDIKDLVKKVDAKKEEPGPSPASRFEIG